MTELKPPRGTFERTICPVCGKWVAVRFDGLIWAHRYDGTGCDGSGLLPTGQVPSPRDPEADAVPPTRDAYANAAAVASIGYEEGRNALRAACEDGFRNGLTLAELARATGRSERFISALIQEATL
jgi:hypothetical protein